MDATREALSRFSAGMISVAEVHAALCNDIIANVGSTRAGIWYFDDSRQVLTSACVFDSRTAGVSPSMVLSAQEFPAYFSAIKRETFIRAPEAISDDATACLTERYFRPLDIASLLDFVIKIGTDPVAVLCCEHCGETRQWTDSDQKYLEGMAVLLRLSFLMQNIAKRRQPV